MYVYHACTNFQLPEGEAHRDFILRLDKKVLDIDLLDEIRATLRQEIGLDKDEPLIFSSFTFLGEVNEKE